MANIFSKSLREEIFISTIRSIISAQNDREILLIILNYCIDHLQADGVSFLPYDEWKFHYPFIQIDSNGIEIQNEQGISNIEKKQVCKNCSLKHGGDDCILLTSKKTPYKEVKCFSFICETREIGIINLFYKNAQIKIQNQKKFQQILFLAGEMLASTHKKEIEIAASLHSHNGINYFQDLPSSIKILLDNLQKVFFLKFVFLYIPTGLPEYTDEYIFINQIDQVPQGEKLQLVKDYVQDLWNKYLIESRNNLSGWLSNSKSQNFINLNVIPIFWRNENPVGLLVFEANDKSVLSERNIGYFETFASQTALLIRNSRNISAIEFQSVVQERSRLAREIHDGLAQTLAFLKMQTFQMQNYLDQGEYPKLSKILKANYRTLSDAYTDARFAIDDLRIIPANGMTDWITRVIRDYETATEQKVNINVASAADSYSGDIQTQLIRIIQEAFSNIRKHANADNISVLGIEDGDCFVLQIVDNGIGFNHEKLEDNRIKRYGLRGMRERAESIGALLEIVSTPGMGTTVSLKIPLTLKEAA